MVTGEMSYELSQTTEPTLSLKSVCSKTEHPAPTHAC